MTMALITVLATLALVLSLNWNRFREMGSGTVLRMALIWAVIIAFAVGITRLVGGGGTDRPAVLQMGVEAAHDAVGVKGVAVGGAAHGEVVRLQTGAQRLDPPAAHFLGHRGGMMLDHVGRVALEVNRHGLDAGDGAQTAQHHLLLVGLLLHGLTDALHGLGVVSLQLP